MFSGEEGRSMRRSGDQAGAPGDAGHAARASEDDRTAFARISRSDSSAFVALFRRYYDALCAYAEGFVASADDAEEVVSEVFVRIWQGRKRLGVLVSVKGYLYAATRNVALNHLRRRDAEDRAIGRASLEGELPGMSAPSAGAPADVLARDLERAIDDAVANLPARRREIFLLHRQHGLTYAEIATALDLSPKTVENHMGLALRDLRDRLAPYLED